jgi:hypothetical protein
MFKKGDRVKHRSRGEGTFIEYDNEPGSSSCTIELDDGGYGYKETVSVSTALVDLISGNK